jgi:hypothetical protein
MEWSKQNAVDCYGGLNLQIVPDIQIGAFKEAKLDLLSRVGLIAIMKIIITSFMGPIRSDRCILWFNLD